MSNVLFLNIPSNGHVNPTLGLVDELVKEGEQVTYFCSEEYRERIEKVGATFKSYGKDMTIISKNSSNISMDGNIEDKFMNHIEQKLNLNMKILPIIMEQIKGIKFDYVVHSSMFPLGYIISQILKIPSISSFAEFATAKELMDGLISEKRIKEYVFTDKYIKLADSLNKIYKVKMPTNILHLLFIKGNLNIVYTSKFFLARPEHYDDSFIFIGPPIYDRKEVIDFPFEKLKDKKVVYISLGTVFNNTNDKLYDIFFKTFAELDAVVVMTAYNIDISKFHIPENFIVKNYVPQLEILKYTDVAITHAGMNSISDLLYNNVPFVAIPISADQPYMAARASELGATISLDKDNITPEILRTAIEKVQEDPSYLESMGKISKSFKEAGGYKQAVEEIFKLKKEKGIVD